MKPDYEFILVIAFAVIVKQVLSPFHSLFRSFSTAFAAVFCAYVFTPPITHLLGWTDDNTRNAVAAVLGLTGEHIVRHIIDTGQDPDRGLNRIRSVVVKTVEVMTLWQRGSAPAPKADDPEGVSGQREADKGDRS